VPIPEVIIESLDLVFDIRNQTFPGPLERQKKETRHQQNNNIEQKLKHIKI